MLKESISVGSSSLGSAFDSQEPNESDQNRARDGSGRLMEERRDGSGQIL